MKIRAELDWVPGGDEDLPYSMNLSRSCELECWGGFRRTDGTHVLMLWVDDAELANPYDQVTVGGEFGHLPWPLQNWVDDAMLALKPGESGKFKNRRVTRMTEDEIRDLGYIKLTHHNNH